MDLISQCALRVANVIWMPGHGGFAYTVVCKATFELMPDVSPLAAAQEPVVLADVYGGAGGSLMSASELVPFKKRPEVIVIGHAHAPEGRPVSSLVARLAIGEIDKAVQVVGDRYFQLDGRLGEPATFTRMPLTWDRAAGGPDTVNPAGRPTGDGAPVDFFGRVLAPNLLPAGLTMTSRSEIVPPVGFGPIAPRWPSRTACIPRHAAGWDPSRWHERQLPVDLDLACFNAAPADQQRTLPFADDALHVEHLHPRFPMLSTRIAAVSPVVTVDQGSGPQPLQLRCDTLVLDTDRGLAMLVWRAHVLLDHPQRPGRILVNAAAPAPVPAPARASRRGRERGPAAADLTIVPGSSTFSATVLPFLQGAPPAPASSAVVAEPPAPRPSSPGVPTSGPVSREGASMFPDSEVTAVAPPAGAVDATLPPGGLVAAPVPAFLRREMSKTIGPSLSSSPTLPFHGGPQSTSPAPEPAASQDVSALPFSSPAQAYAPPPPLPPPAEGLPSMWAPSPAAPVTQRTPEPPPFTPSGQAFTPGPLSPSLPAEPFSPPAPPLSAAPEAPTMLGALAAVRAAPENADPEPPASEPPSTERPPAQLDAAPELVLDDYPPERCGTIAARLACDPPAAAEVLRAESLDDERWKRAHEHWLGHIQEAAARSRKKPQADYDAAYVAAVEARRGPITLKEYSTLAEAAERGAVAAALAGLAMPEGAWPHVHRVWIGRLVKDVALGRQVRAAIDALRAGS
jgi:hypothetical protein